MAETPEETFLKSMQAQNDQPAAVEENAPTNNSTKPEGGDEVGDDNGLVDDSNEAQQIESSDEYDTAQDPVQDIAISSDAIPTTNGHHQQAQVSSIDSPETTAATASRPSSTLNAPVSDNVPSTSSTTISPSNTATTTTKATPAMSSAHLPSAQKARLPNDLQGILEDRIEADSKGDIDAWLSLINEFKRLGKSEEVRKTYVRFLEAFPLAAEIWAAHIQFENDVNNRRGVEDLFKKVLQDLPSLQLWTGYLDHIRRHFNPATDQNWSKTVGAAFQAILNSVGIDKDAGKLWQDYIEFIESGPGTLGKQDWESQAKMDQLRKAFQEAVSVPTQSVELLWKKYSAFENGLNKMTGRQFLQKKSADYMSARSSYTELQNITRGLDRTTLPKLPPALGFEGDLDYLQQVDIWKRWIQWEKDDPLVLKDDSPKEYKKRIMYVYKQALMALTFWPEMWFDAAEFCFANDMVTEGEGILAQGSKYNPESSLLAFKRADRLEMSTTNGNDEDSKFKRGEVVSEPYHKLLDALHALADKAMAREKQEIARIEAEFANTTSEDTNGVAKNDSDDEDDDEEEDNKKTKVSAADKKVQQINALKAISSVQITLLSKTISHAWIAFMRAMQRMQGKGKLKTPIGGSRQVFRTSHKRGRITSDLWLAAGLLEFHTSDTKAAKNILDRGWKTYPEDEQYALKYIEFLTNIDDHTNARVVFEQTVSKLVAKPETLARAKPLFVFFHKYESQYGELAQIQSLETRMKELFPEDPKLFNFAQRFTFNSFDPTAIRPIISPAAQTRPKTIPIQAPPHILQTIEQSSRQPTPSTVTIPAALPAVNSPKRALDDAFDSDSSRPRKLARGESPAAGATGHRLAAVSSIRPIVQPVSIVAPPPAVPKAQPPPPLPRDVIFLLSIIPPASTYNTVPFKADAMVKLIQDTHIPTTVDQLPINQRPGGGQGYYR